MAWGKKAWRPELLQKAQAARDRTAYNRAFDPFYRYEFPKLAAWLREHFALRSEDIKDLVQSSLWLTYEAGWDGKVRDFHALGGYAQRVLRNQASLQRRGVPHLPLEVASLSLSEVADDPDEIEARYQQLERCLASLSLKCRLTLRLWAVKVPMTDIAQRLGYKNADVAKQIKKRCFKYLADCILQNQAT